MKRIPLFFLLCIFLASCGTPAAPQPIVTFTPTLIPETATPKPKNTLEPSATPTKVDPNRPPAATGYDKAKGYYTKTENGVEKLWMVITDSNGVEQFKDWVENKTKNGDAPNGGIYLKQPNYVNPNKYIPFQFFSTVTDVPTIARNSGYEIANNSFSTELITVLSKRYGKDANALDSALIAGTATIPIKDAEGVVHNFSLSNGQIRVIWVDDVPNPDIDLKHGTLVQSQMIVETDTKITFLVKSELATLDNMMTPVWIFFAKDSQSNASSGDSTSWQARLSSSFVGGDNPLVTIK